MVNLYKTAPKSRRRFGAILALTFVALLISLHQYLYIGYNPSLDEVSSYFHVEIAEKSVDESPQQPINKAATIEVVPPSSTTPSTPELATPSSTEQLGLAKTQSGAVVAAGRAWTNLSWMHELQDR